MFGHVFQMDCKRSFRVSKIIIIALLIVFCIIVSEIDEICFVLFEPEISYGDMYGSLDLMGFFLITDKYKTVIAVLLGAIYTSSFCSDNNTNYLRMILARTDITTYTQSRFLANTLVIVVTSILAFYLFCVVLIPIFPLVNNSHSSSVPIELETIFNRMPLLYVGMLGLQFGMLVAACSSIGLLLSVYVSNAFVSIEFTGMCFFVALCYTPKNTPFRIMNLLSISSPSNLFDNLPKGFIYAWGMLYPTAVICCCGYFFYRRMQRRMTNGYI